MQRKPALLLLLLPLLDLCGIAGFAQTAPAENRLNDPGDRDIFLAHLRENFDDIHDVSMRFHMTDPSIGGRIVFRMLWREGRLAEATVVENETGYPAEAEALLEKIRDWHIPKLVGPSTLDIPLRIRLVGSDHPDFPSRAILTGTVQNSEGRPLRGAEIHFEPAEANRDPVPRARTNREGIYIRTLIPEGRWSLRCILDGFEPQTISGLTFEAGEHRILHITLKPEVP